MGDGSTLLVSVAGTPRLAICGRWLYPLLLLQQVIRSVGEHLSERSLSLTDPIAGRAAAFLYADLGVHDVQARIASRGAFEVTNRTGIHLRAEHTVPSIKCATEAAFAGITNEKQVIAQLEQRAASQFDWISRLTVYEVTEHGGPVRQVTQRPVGQPLGGESSHTDMLIEAAGRLLTNV